MFTIETDNLKIEYVPRTDLHFVVTYEYATIRCDEIVVEDEIVNFKINGEYVAWVQLLEQEAIGVRAYAFMMLCCESKEIMGKQVSYAPMWQFILIDDKEGTFLQVDDEFFLKPKDEELKRLNIEDIEGLAIMGFISMVDKKLEDKHGDRVRLISSEFSTYGDIEII
ncbi:hypothetical protein QTV43_003988 [Vibrio vulnificus]|nr:hypothetical protein [Vibrio vulnificus]